MEDIKQRPDFACGFVPILEQPDQWTYSKKEQMARLLACKDTEFGRSITEMRRKDLKWYQDLIVHIFIKQYIPPGARILEVGGGHSRILGFYRKTRECWNLDKFEGVGEGPLFVPEWAEGIRAVFDYAGNFNPELPEGYFDFVFSISVLEHLDFKKPGIAGRVIDDINRVLKPGGYSFHAFDATPQPRKKEQLRLFFDHQPMMNKFFFPDVAALDPDLHDLTEEVFNQVWKKADYFGDKTYQEVGPYFSYNFFWQKPRCEKELKELAE